MTPEVTMLWTHAEKLGYGRMGVKLAETLRDGGMTIYERQGLEAEDQYPDRRPEHKRTNVVCTISYPSHLRGWYDGQHKVVFTMFESTRLPEAFTETIHEYDTVLVPSRQNVELFERYHPNVRLVPLGIDPTDWHYQPRNKPGIYFDFLVGGSGPRKGVDIAVEAFRRGFTKWPPRGPVPRLIVKSPKPQDIIGDRITQLNGFLTPEQERDLYAASHCYLQPSRGEGFGLQPLQAIAQGLPTILTDAHGHEAFAHLGYGIPSTLADIPYGYFSIGDAGQWWEPDVDELVERMRHVYHHYDEASAFAERSAKLAAEHFTWEHAADRFVAAIGADQFTQPYTGSGAWRTPQVKYFKVRVLRRHKAEMPDGLRIWEPGRDYMDTADVKRILMDSGVLDPECVSEFDPGMDAAAAERYSARHTFCPTCDQKLGSGITRADEIELELNAGALA